MAPRRTAAAAAPKMVPIKEHEKVLKAEQKQAEINYKLKEDYDDLQEDYDSIKTELDETRKENDQLKSDNKELVLKLKTATETLSTAGGKATKSLVSEDIMKKLVPFIKQIVYRNTKFARGGTLVNLTKKIYEKIKDDLDLGDPDNGLTESEFVTIYKPEVSTILSYARQYSQSRCQSAAQGKNQCVLCHGICLLYTKFWPFTLNFGPLRFFFCMFHFSLV